jgi:hypothetical protein
MNKILTGLMMAVLTISAVNAKEITKQGFLTTEQCLENDYFTDCRLESYADSKLALYVHGDLDYYIIDASHLEMREVDEGFARDKVSITGKYDAKTNTIHATKYKGPPPPTKSFFKGCM